MDIVQKKIDKVKTKFNEAEKTKLDIEKFAKEKGLETVTEVKDVLDKMNEIHPKIKEKVDYLDQKLIYNDEWDNNDPNKKMITILTNYYNNTNALFTTGDVYNFKAVVAPALNTKATASGADPNLNILNTKVKTEYLTNTIDKIKRNIDRGIGQRNEHPLIIKPLVEVPLDYSNLNDKIRIAPDCHYNVDYILRYYEHYIGDEISKDPTTPNDIYFVDFVKSVSVLVGKIWIARTKGKGGGTDFDYDGKGFMFTTEESYYDGLFKTPNQTITIKYSKVSGGLKLGKIKISDLMERINNGIHNQYVLYEIYKLACTSLHIVDALKNPKNKFMKLESKPDIDPGGGIPEKSSKDGFWVNYDRISATPSKDNFLLTRKTHNDTFYFGYHEIDTNKTVLLNGGNKPWSIVQTYFSNFKFVSANWGVEYWIDHLNKIFVKDKNKMENGIKEFFNDRQIYDSIMYVDDLINNILRYMWNSPQSYRDDKPHFKIYKSIKTLTKMAPTDYTMTDIMPRINALHDAMREGLIMWSGKTNINDAVIFLEKRYRPNRMQQQFLGLYFNPFETGAKKIPIDFEQIETKRKAYEENKNKKTKMSMRQIEPMMEEEKQDLKQFAESYSYAKVQESLTRNVKSINQNMQSVMGFSQDAVKSLDSIDLHLITDPDILYPFGTDDHLKEIEASLILTKSTTDIMDVDKDVDLDTEKIIVDDSDIDKPQTSVMGELGAKPGAIAGPPEEKTHEDFAKSKAKSEAEKQMREAGIRICKAGDIIDLKHHKDDVMKHLRPRIILNPNYKKGGPDSDKKYLLTDRSPEAIKVVAEQISKDRAAYDKGWTDHAKSRTNVYATDAFYAKSYLGGN